MDTSITSGGRGVMRGGGGDGGGGSGGSVRRMAENGTNDMRQFDKNATRDNVIQLGRQILTENVYKRKKERSFAI